MSQPQDKPEGKKQFDLIHRGSKKPTPLGTATFIGLRLADLPWQYYLLHNGAAERAISALHLPVLQSAFTATSVAWLAPLDLPLPRLILLAMATGSTLKQIFWQTYLSQEEFPPSAAAAVSVFNTVVNTVNSLLFVCASTSSALSYGPKVTVLDTELPLAIVAGTVAYVAGMTIETLSEYQRLKFKQDPKNQGKVCKVGLWSWARHINYFGYALWRGGYCMVGSGWIGGLAMGLWQGWDLSSRASATLDEYCSNKYGEQWVQFKKDVPYRIIPCIY
ncbi:membrane protein [Seiridium cupressi]